MDGFHSSQKANLPNFDKLFPGGDRSGTGLSLKVYFWNLFLAYGGMLTAANGKVGIGKNLALPNLANRGH
jgi:hypothetical protein